MASAQAAVLNAVREPLSVEPLAVRDPRDGEVLVRLGASGVCHSDLHAITGDLPMPLPCVLGHEGAGADLLDDARALVAEHAGERHGEVSGDGVQVTRAR